jgi:4-alpha-glucanotransferase
LSAPAFPKDRVDFAAVERFKLPLLRKAFDAFEAHADSARSRDFTAFRADHSAWVEDYALFSALRGARSGASWTSWDAGLRGRKPKALEEARRALVPEVRFHLFVQYQFHRQWEALREHCRSRGIGLIGDIPIFVAHDSAEVWSNQELFWLDREGQPLKVAGVPPDYFSRTGQLWGNPLYRWDAMGRRKYSWWISRLRAAFERFDAVRLDHFIGFHNYWEIKAGSPTAEKGRWVPAPGEKLFAAARKKLGRLPLIAEDLGVVTSGVKALRDLFGFPGLRVLQMAFGTDPEAENYKPHSYPRRCVAYTGTHDNDTSVGWFDDEGSASSTRTQGEIRRERAAILDYLGRTSRPDELNWELIRLVLMSAADTAIVPVQDLLGLGSSARMNLPGTASGNWAWRMEDGALTPDIRARWSAMTRTYGRASASGKVAAPGS